MTIVDLYYAKINSWHSKSCEIRNKEKKNFNQRRQN